MVVLSGVEFGEDNLPGVGAPFSERLVATSEGLAELAEDEAREAVVQRIGEALIRRVTIMGTEYVTFGGSIIFTDNE